MKRLLQLSGSIAVIHGLEDVALLSIGRFLPVPIWLMYVIGIGVSTILLTALFNRLSDKLNHRH